MSRWDEPIKTKAAVIFAVIVSFGCGLGIQQNRHLTNEFKSESCRSKEVVYNKEVKQISQTYDYLDRLIKNKPEEINSGLNQTIIRLLPKQYNDLKNNNDIPKSCSKGGVGLDKIEKLPPYKDYSRYLVEKR